MFPPITYSLRDAAYRLKTSSNTIPKLAVCHSNDDFIMSDTWEMIDLTASMVDVKAFPIALPRNNMSQCQQILRELNAGESDASLSS
jgi:hypothetical protein